MNIIVIQAIRFFANLILGSGILDRVVPIVTKWSEKQISGLEKHPNPIFP